jgi:catechol 2,3-dioxygenase-like lactoylglutathione lyase family enzyme
MDEEVIPVLKVKDAAKSAVWYARLGFGTEWVHRFGPDFPAFMSMARGKLRVFLSEHEGDARPDTLVYIRVRDVSLIASEFGVAIEEQPWAHEVYLTDPDGNRLRIGTPKA